MKLWQPGLKLADIEKICIEDAFLHFGKNKTKTAEALGIAVRTLDARLEEYATANVEKKDKGKTKSSDINDVSHLKQPFYPHAQGHKPSNMDHMKSSKEAAVPEIALGDVAAHRKAAHDAAQKEKAKDKEKK